MTDNSTSTDSPHETEAERSVTPPYKSRKAPRRTPAPSALRRQVELTLRVSKWDISQRSLLAKVVGADPGDVAGVIVATLDNLERARSLISVVQITATADPMEAGIVATMLATDDRGRFRTAWSIVSGLGASLATQVPTASAEAGLALARAAQTLTPDAKNVIGRLVNDLGG